ncbi:MAG: molybdopterin-guanine dinucleotide biosynthesis protein MobB [Thermoanaerobaculia bacterium]|nr:molybdopterin-guanine dinucleotide biosynthesis protein MobB [Thermoanaerobaculia bacterium]
MGNVIGIIGSSGSGKTTLICRILDLLPEQKTTVIKRTHHLTPGFSGGKDTDKYLEAGAAAALLVTPVAVHHFHRDGHRKSGLAPIEEIVASAASRSDLVIIESAKYDGAWPRILVHDEEIGTPRPLPPHIEAVVTTSREPVIDRIPQFGRDEIDEIGRFVFRITS